MENQEMMEKLQKSLKINRILNVILITLMICLLAGGYFVVQKITPAMGILQEVRTSLQALEQLDYQALNQTLAELDVEALNEKIEALDMEILNEKLEQLDVDNLNELLDGLDAEEMSEALENLNNAVDKLEKVEENLGALGEWFNSKFKF